MPLLTFTRQKGSVQNVIDEVVESIQQSKKDTTTTILDKKEKDYVKELVNSFIIGARELDSLEQPFEFFFAKTAERQRDTKWSAMLQVFFLTTCTFYGGEYYTKDQNGAEAKMVCVDLNSFPCVRDESYKSRVKRVNDGDIFVCAYPDCKVQGSAKAFVFKDVQTQCMVTKLPKKFFASAENSKERKNFFRHIGSHFIGININKHRYCENFELIRVFFPSYFFTTSLDCGDFEKKRKDAAEKQHPYPFGDGVPGEEHEEDIYEIIDESFHFYNENFDMARELDYLKEIIHNEEHNNNNNEEMEEEEEGNIGRENNNDDTGNIVQADNAFINYQTMDAENDNAYGDDNNNGFHINSSSIENMPDPNNMPTNQLDTITLNNEQPDPNTAYNMLNAYTPYGNNYYMDPTHSNNQIYTDVPPNNQNIITSYNNNQNHMDIPPTNNQNYTDTYPNINQNNINTHLHNQLDSNTSYQYNTNIPYNNTFNSNTSYN